MTQERLTVEQLLASHPETSAWVSANAGSGKTHVLTRRVARLLLSGATPQSILCLTFTKAAAAEMSNRLFDLLAKWITMPDDKLRNELADLDAADADLSRARQLFARAIETPGGLKIQTIHAFCEKLLQLFPVEAGLAPGFRVMDENSTFALMRQAFNDAVMQFSEAGSDVQMTLLDDGEISSADMSLKMCRLFLEGASPYRMLLEDDINPSSLGLALKAALGVNHWSSINDIEVQLQSYDHEMCGRIANELSPHPFFKGHDIVSPLRKLSMADDVPTIVESVADLFLVDKGTLRKDLMLKGTIEALPVQVQWLKQFRDAMLPVIEQHGLYRSVEASQQLISLMRQVHSRFAALKKQAGHYDFDDLILRTADLLSTSRAAQWVLYKLDHGLAHILVDEAQDTNPAQWQVIRSLSTEFFAGEGAPHREPRTMFAVGDVKQSIFSFQGADVRAFSESEYYFSEQVEATGNDFEHVRLGLSYRSAKPVLDFVDEVFAEGSKARFGFGSAELGGTQHDTNLKTLPGLVEIWPVMAADENAEAVPWTAPVDRASPDSHVERQARFVAETVASWIGKRLTWDKKGETQRPIHAGDILVLFKSRSKLFSALIAQLRKVGVPVAGADRLVLGESLAVHDLCALADCVLLQENELALAAVLKSPLVPYPLIDDQLQTLAANRGVQLLWDQALAQKNENAAWLLQCQAMAREGGAYQFFAQALNRFRLAMVTRLGPEALDATNMFLDLVRDFEAQRGADLSAFLSWFRQQEGDQRRELEQAGQQLRLMTVHGAKGLEANIVILADAVTDVNKQKGTRVLTVPVTIGNTQATLPLLALKTRDASDRLKALKENDALREELEYKRLLYVAVTRARQELYVGGCSKSGKAGKDTWYGMIDEVLENTKKLDFFPRDIGHPMGDAWRHGADYEFGERPVGAETSQTVIPDWLFVPVATEAAVQNQSVTALAAGSDKVFDRKAVRRGLAVHRFLELWPQGKAADIGKLARRVGLEVTEAYQLVSLVESKALAPFFARYAKVEVRLAGELEDGRWVEGQVDRLVVKPDEILMLDYKSGQRSPELEVKYLDQLKLYAELLRGSYPGRTLRGALLWTEIGELEWLNL